MTCRRYQALFIGVVAIGALAFQPRAAAAADLDCTSGCNQLFQGLFWSTIQVQPSGTGVIDSFLRIQRNSLEEGMNTDYRPLALDEKTDPNYTRDIQLGEIATVTINGVSYYELLLDINEPSGGATSLLTLVGLKLCVSGVGMQYNELGGGCSGGSNPGSTATQVYNLDAVGNNRVQLDYDYLSTGSGGSDLFVYVPVSLLGVDPNTYLYLWSQFGFLSGGDKKSQDGFEEWAVRGGNGIPPPPPPPLPGVPEPASLLLLGSGLVLTALRARRPRR